MASRDENREIAKRFNEAVFDNHDMEYLRRVLADDFVEHNPIPGFGMDRQGTIDTISALFQGAADFAVTVDRMVAGDDRVAIQSTVSGTDTGGQMGMAPTGKAFSVGTIDVIRINPNGSLAEHWGIFDVMGLMQQLGVMPAPGG